MKTKTVYESKDGKYFDTESECLSYEKKLEIVEYLENDDELYWREISPEEVVESLLKVYSINENDKDGRGVSRCPAPTGSKLDGES